MVDAPWDVSPQLNIYLKLYSGGVECVRHVWCVAVCGMRYKTRPGLTYHYAHSHKEEKEEEAKPKAPARPNEQIQANDPIPDYFPGQLQASATPNWGQNSYYQGWSRVEHFPSNHYCNLH